MSAAAASSWRSTFTSVPPLTKSVVTAMTVMTSLGLLLRFRDMALAGSIEEGDISPDSESSLISLLAMVPVSAPYRFWTFATASFFERSIIQARKLIMDLKFWTRSFIFNAAIMLGCGKYMERAWGSREFFKYLAITSVGTMIAIYATCLFEYVVRGKEELLYNTQAYGLTAIQAGFLIGFKQLVPEHLVTLYGIISVRVKTLPLIFALFMAFQSLIFRSQIEWLMAIYGLFISWIYARFFKTQDGMKGDRSETFSFASFFPEALQPPVKSISNLMFGLLVSLHICSPLGFTLEGSGSAAGFSQSLNERLPGGMELPTTQPANLRAEAERRRALALKALDMRLHAAAGNSASLPGLSQKTFLGPTASSAGTPPPPPPMASSSAPNSTSTSTITTTELPAYEDKDVLFETTAMDDENDVSKQ
ncbi:hypothetical protein BGZ83_010947 [Gryganskiella cystojenkinii]|nr:hypothetical protein BGZ83_010947 [Gryganskiella cystojenkinii]